VIVLRVSEIKNPAKASFSLETGLAPCAGVTRTWEPERLTSLGVYPADQPASYAVPVSAATLDRLRTRGVSDLKDVCLQVKLRLMRQAGDAVEVVLAAPEWQQEK